MTELMRSSEITGRPVVTLGGEDVAQIKDIVFVADEGEVGGFTLAGRGVFAGPLDVALPWSAVHALGRSAVMIADPEDFEPLQAVVDRAAKAPGRGDVLGSRVLTDAGTELGTVRDVIIQVTRESCTVVGYEIASADSAGSGTTMLIPLPETTSASGEHLVVPSSVTKFVRHDMAGFGAAVEEFRQHLGGRD